MLPGCFCENTRSVSEARMLPKLVVRRAVKSGFILNEGHLPPGYAPWVRVKCSSRVVFGLDNRVIVMVSVRK